MSTLTETAQTLVDNTKEKVLNSETHEHKEPLKLSGILDQYESFDVTPVIGREFPNAKLKEWLEAPNSDELIRDLAITSKFVRDIRLFMA